MDTIKHARGEFRYKDADISFFKNNSLIKNFKVAGIKPLTKKEVGYMIPNLLERI